MSVFKNILLFLTIILSQKNINALIFEPDGLRTQILNYENLKKKIDEQALISPKNVSTLESLITSANEILDNINVINKKQIESNTPLRSFFKRHSFYAASDVSPGSYNHFRNAIVSKKIELNKLLPGGVRKINENLYVGTVEDEDNKSEYYMAMERVTPQNVEMWSEYSEIQHHNLGAIGFKTMIRDYKRDYMEAKEPNYELWIAYISRVPVTKNIKLNTLSSKELRKIDMRDFYELTSNPDIEMFVTVSTSPESLITHHMGISRTREANEDLATTPPKRIKHSYQSVHLHSFAAKVMKKRDSRKKYMMTAPLQNMLKILLDKMPDNTVFIGDNLYKERIEEEAKDYAELDSKEKARYNTLTNLLKSNPPRILITKKGQEATIQSPDGSPLINIDKENKNYQWIINYFLYPTNSVWPRILVDLDALAAVKKLAS